METRCTKIFNKLFLAPWKCIFDLVNTREISSRPTFALWGRPAPIAGRWDLEGAACAVTLVPHLNAKLINRVWDSLFVSVFWLLSRSFQEQEMKYPSPIPFHLQACFSPPPPFQLCCSDDKVSPSECYLVSKEEKELKASLGG